MGFDPEFARNVEESFDQRAEELKPTAGPSYKQLALAVRSSLLPEWAKLRHRDRRPRGRHGG